MNLDSDYIYDHIMVNYEYYFCGWMTLILYFNPYLFISVNVIYTLYLFYTTINSEFNIELKFNNRKYKNKGKLNIFTVPDFNKPILDEDKNE